MSIGRRPLIESIEERQKLGREYVPIELLGSQCEAIPSAADIGPPGPDAQNEHCMHVWCCFLDPGSNQLWMAHANLPFDGSPGCISKRRLKTDRVSDRYAKTLTGSRQRLVDGLLHAGMTWLDGQWYIRPYSGKVFDASNLVADTEDVLGMADVGMNGLGFRSIGNESDNQVDQSNEPVRQDIAARLATANPNASSWIL